MNWNFMKIAAAALFVLALPLAQAQTVKVSIAKSEYQFPDDDACVYFDWEALGVQDHNLQLTLRAIQSGTGDFLVNSAGDSQVADSAGLLARKLDVEVPFDHTEWDDTFLCLPAGQFPSGNYDWYPVITIVDLTTGDLLLMRHFRNTIHYGQSGFRADTISEISA
jgi:hypothetical protein